MRQVDAIHCQGGRDHAHDDQNGQKFEQCHAHDNGPAGAQDLAKSEVADPLPLMCECEIRAVERRQKQEHQVKAYSPQSGADPPTYDKST